jgi:hypothetical protein
MAKVEKCTFCGAPVVGEPYWETIGGKKLPFAAKGCAEAYKDKQKGVTAKETKGYKCTFCLAPIVGEPYWEVVGGKKMPFAAKGCADEFKKKIKT